MPSGVREWRLSSGEHGERFESIKLSWENGESPGNFIIFVFALIVRLAAENQAKSQTGALFDQWSASCSAKLGGYSPGLEALRDAERDPNRIHYAEPEL